MGDRTSSVFVGASDKKEPSSVRKRTEQRSVTAKKIAPKEKSSVFCFMISPHKQYKVIF
jgi:hypothetical protein